MLWTKFVSISAVPFCLDCGLYSVPQCWGIFLFGLRVLRSKGCRLGTALDSAHAISGSRNSGCWLQHFFIWFASFVVYGPILSNFRPARLRRLFVAEDNSSLICLVMGRDLPIRRKVNVSLITALFFFVETSTCKEKLVPVSCFVYIKCLFKYIFLKGTSKRALNMSEGSNYDIM